MAIHENRLAKKIVIWARRPETRKLCREQPWCDEVYGSNAKAVKGSDFVAICAPVTVIPDLAAAIAPHLAGGTIVTDVGSTKEYICNACEAALPEDVFFVGSHPMAGSEKSGPEHASSQLFSDLPCLITPLAKTPPQAINTVQDFWEKVGMHLHQLDPESHDAIAAQISHLPHLLAIGLCYYLSDKDSSLKFYAGNGLRDTTRIASGNTELWRGILSENRHAILKAMDQFSSIWDHLRNLLSEPESPALLEVLQQAKTYRDTLEG